MVKRVDLNEAPAARMARLLRGARDEVDKVQTRPTGVKDLGQRGDVIWPVADGPNWVTWSIKDLPQITETLSAELAEAAQKIVDAQTALDAIQGDIDGINLDVDGLNGQIGSLQQTAAAAQEAADLAEAAAQAAAQDAADALEAAQNASGKQQIYFGATAPVGDPDVLWIDDQGQPYQWVGTPPDTGQWTLITDPRITAAAQEASAARGEAQTAAQAATDAATAAAAAEAAADAAATTANQALVSANARNSRIISLQPATGTAHPETGRELVAGDTWWQWDTTLTRNVVGAWVWDGDSWEKETLTDSVLNSLDVNKLLVLGEARMTQAVVEKIFGDAAFFNAINVEDLTVTGGAVIDEAVIAKLAVAMIVTQALRTEVDDVTGLYAILDSFGLRVIDNDGGPEGDPMTLVQLGPSGNNLIQLGDPDAGLMASIDSAGNVTGQRGTFTEIWVNGRQISAADMREGPRGLVGYGLLHDGRSRRLNGRNIVLGVDINLAPGRVYKIESSSAVVDSEHATCNPFLQLHTSFGGETPPWDNWSGTCRKESTIGPYGGFRTLPGMKHWLDLTGMDSTGPDVYTRVILSLGNLASNGWVQAAGVVDHLWLTVEDAGSVFTDHGNPWFDTGGSTPPPPPPTRRVVRFHPYEWGTWLRGGSRDLTEKPTQGQWSEWNRSCYFFFPDMTAELAGADIHRITLFSWADHWGGMSGTGRWHWHNQASPMATDLHLVHILDTPGWPRGSAMTVELQGEAWHNDFRNGTFRGYGFTTVDTSHEFYGQFSPLHSAHFIDIELSK